MAYGEGGGDDAGGEENEPLPARRAAARRQAGPVLGEAAAGPGEQALPAGRVQRRLEGPSGDDDEAAARIGLAPQREQDAGQIFAFRVDGKGYTVRAAAEDAQADACGLPWRPRPQEAAGRRIWMERDVEFAPEMTRKPPRVGRGVDRPRGDQLEMGRRAEPCRTARA